MINSFNIGRVSNSRNGVALTNSDYQGTILHRDSDITVTPVEISDVFDT